MPVAVPEAVPDNVQTWQQAASTPNLLAGCAACTLVTAATCYLGLATVRPGTGVNHWPLPCE